MKERLQKGLPRDFWSTLVSSKGHIHGAGGGELISELRFYQKNSKVKLCGLLNARMLSPFKAPQYFEGVQELPLATKCAGVLRAENISLPPESPYLPCQFPPLGRAWWNPVWTDPLAPRQLPRA